MNEGQYDSKNVEHISIENIEVVSNGMDWKSRHLEAEKRKKIGGTASRHLPYRMLNKIEMRILSCVRLWDIADR